MKTQSENPTGLHLRYIVKKANGEPVDSRAEYFVLRLDRHAKDQRHVEASRRAVYTYAREIEPFLPQLAAELREQFQPMLRAEDEVCIGATTSGRVVFTVTSRTADEAATAYLSIGEAEKMASVLAGAIETAKHQSG
jgi:hypothetical protein